MNEKIVKHHHEAEAYKPIFLDFLLTEAGLEDDQSTLTLCSQAGILSCKAVSINNLDMYEGQIFWLIQGIDIQLEVQTQS